MNPNDNDVLHNMTESDKVFEILKLRKEIRYCRDQKGDDRCWMDLERLYQLLPEGYTPPERDTTIELENCKKYIESCNNPYTQYVSPQRRIEELEEENKILNQEIDRLKDRSATEYWPGV